ncbi:TonB-dependent receptor [Sphingosinicella sp. LHD-64]|uniref:TonB-dependent receptor n=1 Tax=Sphingosinicella sp. LHD-64 TaxID=3072139 RepID=UPI00280F9E07|nr:TonB-dependent receptor [Sphingosinicella sp. LHD-64]MDQ8757684.1 TonB-dependent receptor [Sphingosinicella sp. LHD-64]
MPGIAFAQSTGTVDFEGDAIVVTGSRARDVGGVEVPDTPRARAVLDSSFIQRQTPGQTINDVINSLPGVSFQNNDPYGAGGGTLNIRGFDATRISQTFDGFPQNDTGNYALYSNQQLDPELIDQVNVSLGSTDIDSPTAAASGSTVNYRTRLPTEDFHVSLRGSIGEYNMFRAFGVVDTGQFTPWGTRAFLSASMQSYDNPYNNRGTNYKQQYNARIYQPIGDNGDFVSIAAHYNQNRNNFFGSVSLREDLTLTQSPTSAPRNVPDRFPLTDDERFYTVARCQINTASGPGSQLANTCGSTFDERYNPSNTGNVRFGSRFTLTDRLVFTMDGAFQYTKANGGGTVVGFEGRRDVNPNGGPSSTVSTRCQTAPSPTQSCQTGYISGIPYYGRDLNGDGDILDSIRVLAPSQTQTDRYLLLASLRYDITDEHSVRLSYSFDRGIHRQTGETGFLQLNGEPFDVFPVNDPLVDVNGNILQKRDRRSIALLNQISGEYRGEFLDGRLVVNAGVRVPFFKRDLTNFCATSSVTGFVECFSTNDAGLQAWLINNPTVPVAGGVQPVQGPQNRVFKYDDILPTLGFTYDLTPRLSLFANYSRGLQVPGTDNLYNSFYFSSDTPEANPRPETTDNFDLGLRYRSGAIQAQASVWYTRFQDRLASSFDPELERSVYRNLGAVDKYGIDGLLSWQVIPELQFSVFGSYLWSNIRDDVLVGLCSATVSESCPAGSVGTEIFAPTEGSREGGAPVYTFGARVQGNVGPLEIGVQFKRTGGRYVNDSNQPIGQCFSTLPANLGASVPFVNTIDCPTGSQLVAVYPARTPAYNIVDLDARLPLGFIGLNDDTFLQLNVTNLFDERYVGGFTANLLPTQVPFAQIGAPRAVSATLVVGF